jgi:hypothetical protein
MSGLSNEYQNEFLQLRKNKDFYKQAIEKIKKRVTSELTNKGTTKLLFKYDNIKANFVRNKEKRINIKLLFTLMYL